MNTTDYTYLINKPDVINERQTESLVKILIEFPYFQSARAIYLKGLHNQNSFKYNFALKTTAAHTTDRSVLFDFITSDSFTAIQKVFYDKKTSELLDINVIDGEIIVPEIKYDFVINTLEQSIVTSIKEAEGIGFDENRKTTEEKLALGSPLNFATNETHSFQEWLQLSRTVPIDREEKKQNVSIEDENKRKKTALIDRFIETSPKISPLKQTASSNVSLDLNTEDTTYLMTETLARVYLEQKKYLKAIQAYEILILKYPEKSSFFADRIADIKILQQNNN